MQASRPLPSPDPLQALPPPRVSRQIRTSFGMLLQLFPRPPDVGLPCSLFPPGIVTALTWPASLLTVASVIDNPWGVCLHRSAEVGKHLAQILLRRQQVEGPKKAAGQPESLGAGEVQKRAARVTCCPFLKGKRLQRWGFLAQKKAMKGECDSDL